MIEIVLFSLTHTHTLGPLDSTSYLVVAREVSGCPSTVDQPALLNTPPDQVPVYSLVIRTTYGSHIKHLPPTSQRDVLRTDKKEHCTQTMDLEFVWWSLSVHWPLVAIETLTWSSTTEQVPNSISFQFKYPHVSCVGHILYSMLCTATVAEFFSPWPQFILDSMSIICV